MKKVCYLMHVDYNSIKQRPHFIAEKLSEYYNLDLICIRNYGSQRVNNQVKGKFRLIRKVPYSAKNKTLKVVERWINRSVLQSLYSNDYDFIWITSPVVLHFIDLTQINARTIIYDCMDDALAFPLSKINIENLSIMEQQLLSASDIILSSSTHLKEVLMNRGAKTDIHLVLNAMNSTAQKKPLISPLTHRKDSDFLNIMYFGTIAKWFDFEVILSVLDIHQDIMFTIIGPAEVSLPTHPRVHYMDAMPHDELIAYSSTADAFIMPFTIDDLILSVDPVKVYEYISLLKPCIVVKYPETEKFDPYVYLYNGAEQLSNLIGMIKSEPKMKSTKERVNEFITLNTWDARLIQITRILNDV